jgi:hypothetical protein
MLPKRTILSYFPVQGEHNTLSASVFPNNSNTQAATASSGSTTNQSGASLTSQPSSGDLQSSPGKFVNGKDVSKKETSAKSETKATAGNGNGNANTGTSSSSGNGVFPKPGLPSSMTVPAEFKKQLEAAKMAKEQAEAKVL